MSAAEKQALADGLKSPLVLTRRRSQILLQSEAGRKAPEIAEDLGCSDMTVRRATAAFGERGAACLHPFASEDGALASGCARSEQRGAGAGGSRALRSCAHTRAIQRDRTVRSLSPALA